MYLKYINIYNTYNNDIDNKITLIWLLGCNIKY